QSHRHFGSAQARTALLFPQARVDAISSVPDFEGTPSVGEQFIPNQCTARLGESVSANTSHPGNPGLLPASLFPDEDYRFQIRFDCGAPADFFRPTGEHQRLLSERRHWLTTSPETYSA